MAGAVTGWVTAIIVGKPLSTLRHFSKCPKAVIPKDRLDFTMPHSDTPTLEAFIGNTPLVRLQRLPGHTSNRILGKLEGNNPAGSVKDRPAPVSYTHLDVYKRQPISSPWIRRRYGVCRCGYWRISRRRGIA